MGVGPFRYVDRYQTSLGPLWRAAENDPAAMQELLRLLEDRDRQLEDWLAILPSRTQADYYSGLYTVNPFDVGNTYFTYSDNPSVTMTTGARVLVTVSFHSFVGSTFKTIWMSVAVSGATTAASSDAFAAVNFHDVINAYQSASASFVYDINPGSNTFTVQTKGDGGSYSMTAGRIGLVVQRLD